MGLADRMWDIEEKYYSKIYKLDIDIGVWDLSHLNKIISALRKLSVIHRVTRIID